MSRIATLLLLIPFAGCALDNRRKGDAFISDMDKEGCEILAVDGNPPTRWHHSLVTVLPAVLVPPGTHKFTTRNAEFVARVEDGKNYRATYASDGSPMLVEKH